MKAILRNVTLLDSRGVRMDIAIDGDRIAEIAPHIDASAESEFDGNGRLAVPGLINAHMHLDKCLLGGGTHATRPQTVQEMIERAAAHKPHYTESDIMERASKVVDAAMTYGTTTIRAFSDVDTIGGLVGVKSLLALKQRYQDRVTLQVVAFPQEGIFRDPGCAELMEDAVNAGVDVVGGHPTHELTDALMRDHIDFCLDLAQRHDRDLHVLLDDSDSPLSRGLEYLAVRTREEGYEGRVVAGPCGALSAYDHSHAQGVIRLVKNAEISIVSNSHISLALTGWNDRGLVRRGITRVRELLEAGVNVAAAQDDVNDPYYPFGKPDQLEVAQYMAHVALLTHPADLATVFDMVTFNAARAIRLSDYGLTPARRADLVVIDATSLHDAIRLTPPRRWVFYGGDLVAESWLEARRYGGDES